MLLFLFLTLAIAGSFIPSENKKSLAFSILACFSFKTNYKELMTKRVSKPGDNTDMLDGVRVIAMIQVMISHCFTFKTHLALYNIEELGSFLSTIGNVPTFCELCVNTFFWLGGFLAGFLTLQQVEKKRGKIGAVG